VSEQFYDEKVAPELLRLAELCKANGLSFVAEVEWTPGESGTTAALQADASFAIRLVHTATKARGNVDALMMALMRYGREHGHNSAALSILNVPATPEGKD
jgi:hypothetical protein